MANYVLVHGAFQGGWIWKKVATLLRAEGHMVYTPTMDGCAERSPQNRPEITHHTHIRELVDFLFYEDLQDVIMTGTSIGGMIITYAADQARERIKHLVFLEALAPLPGEKLASLLVPIPGNSGAKWEGTKIAFGPAREFIEGKMLADVEAETRVWAAKRFGLHPRATPEVADETGFWNKKWSATVINCRNSSNPSYEHQKRTADKLNADFLELDAGHYPMLSHPKVLAEMLLSLGKE